MAKVNAHALKEMLPGGFDTGFLEVERAYINQPNP